MSTSSPTAPRSYSTRELQAAAAALAAGRFSTTNPTLTPMESLDQQGKEWSPTSRSQAAHQTSVTGSAPRGLGVGAAAAPGAVAGPAPLVRILAANSGAGASTIALAMADAADAIGIRVRVLDAATPSWSGLLGATVTELGAADGWRRGRRGGDMVIDRVEEPVQVPADVPDPRAVHGIDLTVLDAGWSMRELIAAPSAWVTSTAARAEVLVTRPHSLALSQTEVALADLEQQLCADQVVVVVVGATRWSDREFPTAGRLLRQAHQQGAVLFAPVLPAKALPGLGPEPLPKQLTKPAQRLLERITTITGPLMTNRT